VELIEQRPTNISSDLLDHEYDFDLSGCLDRAEAHAYAESVRLQLAPINMADFGACARDVGLHFGEGACIRAAAVAVLVECLTGGIDL
jgi:hypothetical protein